MRAAYTLRLNFTKDGLATFIKHIKIKRTLFFIKFAEMNNVCSFGKILFNLRL